MEFIYKRETDSEITDLWLPRGTEKGSDEWAFGISRGKLLQTE